MDYIHILIPVDLVYEIVKAALSAVTYVAVQKIAFKFDSRSKKDNRHDDSNEK